MADDLSDEEYFDFQISEAAIQALGAGAATHEQQLILYADMFRAYMTAKRLYEIRDELIANIYKLIGQWDILPAVAVEQFISVLEEAAEPLE